MIIITKGESRLQNGNLGLQSTNFRWILECPDITRHSKDRLRQTGCSGVFGMIKLNFTEIPHKMKNLHFQKGKYYVQ